MSDEEMPVVGIDLVDLDRMLGRSMVGTLDGVFVLKQNLIIVLLTQTLSLFWLLVLLQKRLFLRHWGRV
jgi:hypothetical protein